MKSWLGSGARIFRTRLLPMADLSRQAISGGDVADEAPHKLKTQARGRAVVLAGPML